MASAAASAVPTVRMAAVTLSFDSLHAEALSFERAGALASRATHAVRVSVGGAVVEVRFDEPRAAATLASRYGDQLAEAAGDFIFYVVRDERAIRFWSRSDRAWSCSIAGLTIEEIVFLADIAAMFDYLRVSPNLSFHAGAVGTPAGVAAIVGHTTAGKTTTTIACARLGLDVYSDERCIVRDGMVTPFHRAISVRAGGRDALVADGVDDRFGIGERLAALECRREAALRPSQLFGRRAPLVPAPLRCVFLISGRADAARAEAIGRFDAAPELLASMVSAESRLARLSRLVVELENVACYRLFLGTPARTAELVRSRLAVHELAAVC